MGGSEKKASYIIICAYSINMYSIRFSVGGDTSGLNLLSHDLVSESFPEYQIPVFSDPEENKNIEWNTEATHSFALIFLKWEKISWSSWISKNPLNPRNQHAWWRLNAFRFENSPNEFSTTCYDWLYRGSSSVPSEFHTTIILVRVEYSYYVSAWISCQKITCIKNSHS